MGGLAGLHPRQARTGVGDLAFLSSVYRAVTLDVMWWLNQKDSADRGVFGGGFLGMDNIGVFDRDEPLPTGGSLARSTAPRGWPTIVLQMLGSPSRALAPRPRYLRMFGPLGLGRLARRALARARRVGVSLWNDETGSTTTSSRCPTARRSRSRCSRCSRSSRCSPGIAIRSDDTEALRTIETAVIRTCARRTTSTTFSSRSRSPAATARTG